MNASDKLDPRIQVFIGYLTAITVLIQTESPIAELVSELRSVGGKVTGFSIQKMPRVDLPLGRVGELNQVALVEKVLFDGDRSYLFGHQPAANSKLDEYLTELIDYLEATPIIVQTKDGLTAEDKARVGDYGGTITSNLSIIDAYSASLPLGRIAELNAWDRVKGITYDRKLIPS